MTSKGESVSADKISVTRWICGKPSCETTYYQEPWAPLPNGYHGSVTQVDEATHTGGDWYACKLAHVRDAITATMDNAIAVTMDNGWVESQEQ